MIIRWLQAVVVFDAEFVTEGSEKSLPLPALLCRSGYASDAGRH
jgi:hypothetical protein